MSASSSDADLIKAQLAAVETAIKNGDQDGIKSSCDSIMTAATSTADNNTNDYVKLVQEQLLQSKSNLIEDTIAEIRKNRSKLTGKSLIIVCSLLFRFDAFSKQFEELPEAWKSAVKAHNVDSNWNPLFGAFTLMQYAVYTDNATAEIQRVFAAHRDSDDDIKKLLLMKSLSHGGSTLLQGACSATSRNDTAAANKIVQFLMDESVRVGGAEFLCQDQLMARDERGYTCLMNVCVATNSQEAVELILWYALEFGDRDFLRWQLEHKNAQGRTALACLGINHRLDKGRLKSTLLNVSSLLSYLGLLQEQGGSLPTELRVYDSRINFLVELKKRIKNKADERKVKKN